MRSLAIALAFLLIGCRDQDVRAEEPKDSGAGSMKTFAGAGRDRMCLDGSSRRAGFITYGDGNTNCAVRGSLQQRGPELLLAPDGDESCRIGIGLAAGKVTLGERSSQCDYYCGPAADFSGRELRETRLGEPVSDFAGDPLC